MVIQSQKFNGKNTGNNEVIVDFDKKDVSFKEIKGLAYNKVDNRISSSLKSVMIRMLVWLFFATIIKHMIGEDVKTQLATMGFVYFGLYLISPVIDWMWKKGDPDSEILPIFNAALVCCSKLLKLKKPVEDLIIKAEDMESNEFVIPHFDNVLLIYKLHRDFAELIERIEIKPLLPSNPYEWKATFKFKEIPKKGHMKLKYI